MRLIIVLACVIGVVGCAPENLFPRPVTPQPVTPQPPAQVTEHVLKITVDGEGKLSLGGAGRIDVANASPRQPEPPALCPCCGSTGVCQGLCGKPGCMCRQSLAAAQPQFETRYERRQVCENGVCRIVSVPVQVPVAGNLRATSGGQIVIYDTGTPAGRAMRQAIGSKGLEWRNSQSPVAIDGNYWSPTAVKTDRLRPNGQAWTPGANGWHAGSAAEFMQWAAQ